MMKFECKKGFIREGERYVHCINGRWDVDVLPICISKSYKFETLSKKEFELKNDSLNEH